MSQQLPNKVSCSLLLSPLFFFFFFFLVVLGPFVGYDSSLRWVSDGDCRAS